jgi:amino acid permease
MHLNWLDPLVSTIYHLIYGVVLGVVYGMLDSSTHAHIIKSKPLMDSVS